MSGENYLRAAYGYLYLGDFKEAMEAFSRAVAAEPDNPSYYFFGSVTAMRNQNWETALRWAREAVRLVPDDALYQEHIRLVESCARSSDTVDSN
ncbi:tetratricopeptide repeat protein [Alicyclobacillus sp. ALC3]|uniref:tetratricopeptide repeat protein n=1 Tax=Alicyclobacillus sp. ALC3 TaxID=2796143 RepID=UPI002377D88E|nr:tetratricopeptide repeat protein [Alicyclobacillus sp. ALC3]WDL97221.1 tetratricopeptide repeat protein [Alicyclobacillus sp. ALC3]